MRIKIESDIFNATTPNIDLIELNYFFNIIFYKERHSIVITDPEILQSDILNQLPNIKDIIERSFTESVVSSLDEYDCLISINGEDIIDQKIFTLEEGIRYLMQPVSIILENSQNDAPFINAIIRSFDQSGTIRKHLDNNWIQFENAGGCDNTKNYILGRCEYYKNKSKFFRCIIILDSDKQYPEHIITKYNKLCPILDEKKIIYHILEKRMMENYLPVDALNNIPNEFKKWLDAYKYLTPQQKDFYNISNGFRTNEESKKKPRGKKKNRAKFDFDKQNQKIKDLFSSVSETNLRYLHDGLKLGNFKSVFPSFFNTSSFVNKKSLLEVTSHQENPQELSDIYNKLKSIL